MNKSIFITENQFNRIVEEIFPHHSIDNIFDVPEEIRKSRLFEAHFKTYPIDTVIKYFKKRYGDKIEIWKREESNNEEVLYIRVDDLDKNQEKLDKDMSLCGFYPSFVEKTNGKREITYEKRHQESINDIVKEKKRIFHFTRRDNVEKILKIGLCPKTNNKLFNYPERIYFFLDKPSLEDSKFFVSQLSKYTKDHSKDYVILEVNVKNINVDFFYDPNLYNAVYTKENISPDRITLLNDKIN